MTAIKLDRQTAISDNRDPRGLQWAIFPQEGKSLFLVRAAMKNDEGKMVPDPKYVVPDECKGEWTHAYKAQEAIIKFLDRFWAECEATQVVSEKRQRANERREAEKEEAPLVAAS